MRILLLGNPNIGKSVIFSRLTGSYVISSNYSGTTVEYTKGYIQWEGEKVEVIDVPGTYSLDPTCAAEQVAVDMLAEGADYVINVLDATHLERNLYLTMQLAEKNIPMILALNLWDEARHKGISIDHHKLEKMMGIPVIPTVALSGEGVSDMLNRLKEAQPVNKENLPAGSKWEKVGRIINEVQVIEHHHHTLLERLEDISIHPVWGVIFALCVLSVTFAVVRFIGEGMIGYVMDPFFENVYQPFLLEIGQAIDGNHLLHQILIGNLYNGAIDFEQSLGLLTTGLYVPIAVVLPYVLAFYFMLGLLEDFGYLVRLAVLSDNLMHKLGLHGFAVIPMILGFGCNVPAALAIRNLENRRDKFIASTLLCVGIPCASQVAVIISLLGHFGNRYILLIFSILLTIFIILGFFMGHFVKGANYELILEIPSYRIPKLSVLLLKLKMRMKSFLKEAIPLVLLGVLIINLFFLTGMIDVIADFTAPVVSGLLGLPKEAVLALIVGFLRKDVAVAMLAPLNLDVSQTIVACIELILFFPCVATFMILVRELGVKDMLKATLIMIMTSLSVGTILNFIL